MSELDKFKRRTIRSVARLLFQEKMPPEELWEEMKKETGSDCRTLWERMRALCVKKLNRMIAVDDRSASLPGIARLSLTDWLLVDLVLVHQEIDVIAMDQADNKEYPVLIELFNLVQRFDVEGRSGDSLAEAWAAATVHYNRQGRQCSPMLLQRRWYQLKKLTRCRFYKFWFSYRGNTRLLEEARKTMPSRLQMAVAKRYPHVITKEYPDWEELIEKRLIIMPEEFETKMRMPNLPKPCDSNAPDLVLVEPVVETIDLRVESDPEDHDDGDMEDDSDPEKSNDATGISQPATEIDTPATEENAPVSEEIQVNYEALDVQVKTEPVEDGLSNVQLISATHVPEVEIPDEISDENPDAIDPSDVIAKGRIDNNPDDEDDVIVLPRGELEQEHTDNIVQERTKTLPSGAPCDIDTVNDSDDAVDDIIKVKADEFCGKNNEINAENNTIDVIIKDKIDTYLKTSKGVLTGANKSDDSTTDSISKADVAAIDLMADLNFVDDGIEFVDDGVEFVEEDNAQNIESTNIRSNEEKNSSPSQEKGATEDNNTFDLKLLMYPVVYTTKLDQMRIFQNKEIDSVKIATDIELALVESKPVSKKSINMKVTQGSVKSVTEDTADSNDLLTNQEQTDDEDIDKDLIVSPNSYLLKKPRTRTYDPIKICKNPDFNTKLKRLTIGFLSSTRNRQLLNACIPLTIDVSKAFEPKLVHGTLHLKSSGSPQTVVKQEVIEKQASSIVPTAMPIQSLIDNSKVDIQNLIPHQSSEELISERTKVINLPDIDKVRRINQQLLTAQVPPLRVYAGNNREVNEPSHELDATVSTASKIGPVEPITESNLVQNTLTKIKVEGEKTEDTTLPPETLPPAKEKLLKIINQAKILTKEALEKIDDAKPKDFPMPIVIKEVKNSIPPEMPTKKHNIQPRVPLAWAPKQLPITNNFDNCGLLTSDTLNKMLHLLMSGAKAENGCKCCGIKKIKKNKPKSTTKKGSESAEDTLKKTQPQKVRTDIDTGPKVFKRKYCCWANQKLRNRKRLLIKHLCPAGACQCCCAELLQKKYKKYSNYYETVNPVVNRRLQGELAQTAKNIVELSDDEDDSKARESIETVVQQSKQLTDQSNIHYGLGNTADIPAATVEDTGISAAKLVTPSINVDVVVPPENKETPSTPPKPFIVVRAAPCASSKSNQTVIKRTRVNKEINSMPHISVNRTNTPRFQMQSQLNQGQWSSCSCQPALGQDSQKYIVIDGSKNCEIHPTSNISKQDGFQSTTVVERTDALNNCAIYPTPIAPKQISPEKRDIRDQNRGTPSEKQEKILYLNSKFLAKSPSESPIFLGKNKILLTTVKFPQKVEHAAPRNDIFQAPKVIPTLPLPAGVQLVLMPSGNVTYSLDPGVELDQAQMEALPTILAAVQEQLNASGVTSTSVTEPELNANTQLDSTVTQPETSGPDNTNLIQSDITTDSIDKSQTDTTTDLAPLVTLETNEVFQDTELPPKNTNDVVLDVDSENRETDAPTVHNTYANTSNVATRSDPNVTNLETRTASNEGNESICNLDEQTASNLEEQSASGTHDTLNKETVDPDAQKSSTDTMASTATGTAIEQVETEANQEYKGVAEGNETQFDKDNINNKKNLLSDLMEMSGISAEDAVAPVPEPPAIEQVEHTSNTIISETSKNLPELSPVTSFAELKYACEQNGKFFKLDFETGTIVPINVCIKKNPKNKTSPMITKELIDLTDDIESGDVENTKQRNTKNKSYEDLQAGTSVLKDSGKYLFNGKTVNISSVVKPVKLFKAFRPPPPRVLKRAHRIGLPKAHPYDYMIKRTHVEKRKQSIKAKVEAKIDLVDSDEPMEEEYLVDSSDDDADVDKAETAQSVVEALDSLNNTSQSDDSSDDEPLAKKSKRLKDVDDKIDNLQETNIFDKVPDVADSTNVDKDLVRDTDKAMTHELIHTVPIPPDGAAIDLDTTGKKDTTRSKESDEPPTKLRNVLSSNIVSEDAVEENDLIDAIEDSEDDDSDKEQPELRFFSDHSEGGDEDCILGV